MKNWFRKVNPNLFALIGGVFISVGVNSYTGAVGADALPERWSQLLVSSACTFLAGLIWMSFAWKLDRVQDMVLVGLPEWMDEKSVWGEIYGKYSLSFNLRIGSALILSVAGLLILLLGLNLQFTIGSSVDDAPNTDPDSSLFLMPDTSDISLIPHIDSTSLTPMLPDSID